MRFASPPPAPDIQASARRLNERLIAAREESGTWLPVRSVITPEQAAESKARWEAMEAAYKARKAGGAS